MVGDNMGMVREDNTRRYKVDEEGSICTMSRFEARCFMDGGS